MSGSALEVFFNSSSPVQIQAGLTAGALVPPVA